MNCWLGSEFDGNVAVDIRYISQNMAACDLELSVEIELNFGVDDQFLFLVNNSEGVILGVHGCLPVVDEDLLRFLKSNTGFDLSGDSSIIEIKFRKSKAVNFIVNQWQVLGLEVVDSEFSDGDNDSFIGIVEFDRLINNLV